MPLSVVVAKGFTLKCGEAPLEEFIMNATRSRKAKLIFGDAVVVSPHASVAFSLKMKVEGTVHENYGVEKHILQVVFSASDSLIIKKDVLLAIGTDGYGCNKSVRWELFRKLHSLGFPGALRQQLSLELLQMYKCCGEVSADAVVRRVEGLFAEKRAKSCDDNCPRLQKHNEEWENVSVE